MGTAARDLALQGKKRGRSMFLVSQRKEARKAARRGLKGRHLVKKRAPPELDGARLAPPHLLGSDQAISAKRKAQFQ